MERIRSGAPSGRRKAASPPPTSRPPLRSSTVLSSRKRTMWASRPRIPAPTRKPASSTPARTAGQHDHDENRYRRAHRFGDGRGGHTTSTAYGPWFDQPAVVTNALGNTTCYGYDLRGRNTAQWGTGPALLFGYDEADRMISPHHVPGGRGRHHRRPHGTHGRGRHYVELR